MLTFVRHYLPGYRSGGPIRTIANLVDHLGDEIDFRIVTCDRDADSVKPYAGISVDSWNRVGKAMVYYASRRSTTLRGVARLIRASPSDVLYLNSFFDWRFTGLPLIVRRLWRLPTVPVVLAPRGEFSRGALEIKHIKKSVYKALVRRVHLYGNIEWQASSDAEKSDIQRELGSTAGVIWVAPNLVSRFAQGGSLDALPGHGADQRLRIIYLSRITPKKNLHYALNLLANVSVPVVFSIYGPVRDAGYWAQCCALMRSLPEHIVVNVGGELLPENVAEVFSRHDLFLFPTRGENFGHVIFEALLAGTSVLISDQTPWEADGTACQAIPLDNPDRFVGAIQLRAACGPDELRRFRDVARTYALRVCESSNAIQANRRLFVRA